jgi:hypothetical protein
MGLSRVPPLYEGCRSLEFTVPAQFAEAELTTINLLSLIRVVLFLGLLLSGSPLGMLLRNK